MGKLTIVLSDSLEERLRCLIRRRGDLSRIIEEALAEWLDRREKEAEGR